MREILFRGQTRRYGEKVRLNGEKIKKQLGLRRYFPQNGDGDYCNNQSNGDYSHCFDCTVNTDIIVDWLKSEVDSNDT